MLKKAYVIATLLILLTVSTVFAQDTYSRTIHGEGKGSFSGYVDIENETGYDIYYLYVSHTDAGWGDDVLGGSTILYDGESIRVNLEDFPSGSFDIKAEDEDEDTYTFWDVDVEYEDVTITIGDLDDDGGSLSYDNTYERTIYGYGKGNFSGYVDVENETGYDIYYLYVSHTNDGWGDDVLGGGTILYDGESIRVNVEEYASSIFDIKAEDEDDDTYTFWSVDVSSEDITITISDID